MASFSKSQQSTVKKVLQNRSFWIGAAVVTSASLIFYDWYNDRYATPQQRFCRIFGDYNLTDKLLRKLRKEFVREMTLGLSESDDLCMSDKKSSLKMLSSKVRTLPNGNECGVYYTLDWGGSNYRIVRMQFDGKNSKPSIIEWKCLIEDKYKRTQNESDLFDHLTVLLREFMISNNDYSDEHIYKIGFTFSFPFYKTDIDSAMLIEWTKGFDVPNVIGKDIVELMHKSFKKSKINGTIHAIVNDTVGTLLSCAFNCDNVCMGLILGTGTNACYFDCELNEIINIEWGAFTHKLLPRMPTDFNMDECTPNCGNQYTEKMCSGYYIGELVRLLSLEVFREKITNCAEKTNLNFVWKFQSEMVSNLLQLHYDNNSEMIMHILQNECGLTSAFSDSDCNVFIGICKLIVNRSADLASCLMMGTLEKCGLYVCHRLDDRNPFESDRFELTDLYKNDASKFVTVAIDGSVFKFVPKYKERMENTIIRICGEDVANRIRLVHSDDGSGKGAALAVAAQKTK